jgi:anti-sigma regulatory factor (Ser/Thr protein kinase)
VRLLVPDIVTLIYLIFDPDSGTLRFANAGHPPPLLVEGNGEASYLEGGLGPPLGATAHFGEDIEVAAHLDAGSTLLLYTDGLVERRGTSIRDGLTRLKTLAADPGEDLEALCDHLLGSMATSQVSDDIALLALRQVPLATEPLLLRLPAEPQVLAPLRQTVRRWLREIDADPRVADEILIACGEACANAIQHAYGAQDGLFEVNLVLSGATVEVTIRDLGSWRPSSGSGRAARRGGLGQRLMRGLMDSVDVNSGSEGTVVRMCRSLQAGAAHEQTRAR